MDIRDSTRKISASIEALLELRVADVTGKEKKLLDRHLADLREAIGQLETFQQRFEQLASSVAGEPSRRRQRGAKPSRRRGRSPDDFPVSAFILETLASHPEGLRPVDLKQRMTELAPGRHTQPAATISTTLTRLKRKGKVLHRGGRWKLARKK